MLKVCVALVRFVGLQTFKINQPAILLSSTIKCVTDVMSHLLHCHYMIKAIESDRNVVTNILMHSFDTNKSVLSIIKKGGNSEKRIKALMEYAFDICMLSGEVYLSDNKKACGLILFSENKPMYLKKALLNLKLLFLGTGIQNALKALEREKAIHHFHPATPFAHLWFLGVLPEEQQKGEGGLMLQQIIEKCCMLKLPIYLETSTLQNLPFYMKRGFTLAGELTLDYTLFILKREFTFCHALARN